MIVEFVMELLKSFFLFILSLFPKLPDLSFISEFISDFMEIVTSVNRFISVPTMGVCFIALFACYNVRAIWSVVMWVIRKIPGVS